MTSFRVLASAMVIIVGISGTFAPSTRAELAAVSGIAGPVGPAGNPEDVAVFPAAPWDFENEELLPGNEEGDFRGAGFPMWYEDTAGLQLTLCLDGEEEGFPCGWEASPVFIDNTCTEPLYPYQEVVGFGDEAFYFKATSFPFDVPLENHPVPGASAQLALLLETTWSGDDRFDENTGRIGGQDIFIESEDGTCESAIGGDLHRVAPGSELLFARIRLRLLGDQAGHAGWYRITYPYGVKTFYHLPEAIDEDNGDDRSQVRQQIGDFRVGVPQDYTIALNDPGAFDNNPNSPFIDVGNSNVTDIDESLGFSNDASVGFKNIGPFLVKPDYFLDPDFLDGFTQYIGNPIEAGGGHPVVGAPYFDEQGFANDGRGEYANYFKIEFQTGDSGILPSQDGWTIVGITDQFNVAGKVAAECTDGLEPPEGTDLLVGTVLNQSITFDPFVGATAGTLPIYKLITVFEDVAQGASVTFNPGSVDITYVPTEGAAYTDTINYALRDACGTESEFAVLTVVIEDLQVNVAQYRARTGRWHVSGNSSYTVENDIRNEISLYAGQFDAENEEANVLIGTATVNDDNSWTFSGKSSASPAAGTITAVSSLGVATQTFDLILR